MKRWNGWGDDSVHHKISKGATHFIESIIGLGTAPKDAAFKSVVANVPASRLPAHPLGTTDAAERVRHASGQCFPDWLALRSGRIGVFPDGVAYPMTSDDICNLIGYGRDAGVRLIPYGGGTSVVGHINPLPGDAPVLTVDM